MEEDKKVEEDKKGIKELSEALCGVMEISICLMENFKDGVQASDFVSIMSKLQSDKAFQEKLVSAYQGVGEIPGEVKDLDLVESSQLIMTMLPYIPKMIEAFKK
jgi:hypothetical protein